MLISTATSFKAKGEHLHGGRSLQTPLVQTLGSLLLGLMVLAVFSPEAAAQTFVGDDDNDGQIVFDDFENGIVDGEYFVFAGGGAGIGLAETSDEPAESSGSTALEATIEGAGGGGFAGYGKGFNSEISVDGIDVSGLGDDPYFTMYFKSNATVEYTLEINLQEDQDGNGTYDGSGAVDDEFQFNYTVSPTASGYTRISVPFSQFFDDNAVNTGGDGVLSDQIANIVFAIGGLPAETFTFTVDDIIYSNTDLGDGSGGGGGGDDGGITFRGDDNGDGILVFDIFEDYTVGDPISGSGQPYFAFSGNGAGIDNITVSNDVPAEASSAIAQNNSTKALEATFNGGDGTGFLGFGRGVSSEVDPTGFDISALNSNPYVTLYFQSTATAQYGFIIEIQEDSNGDGTWDGANEDNFRYTHTVDPSTSGYEFLSIQASQFTALNNSDDGTLDLSRIGNIVFLIAGDQAGLPAETFTVNVDDLGFTDDGSPLPVEFDGFDVQADGSDALLTWRTLSETNNALFDVQVASQSGAFHTVGSVKGAGTTAEPQRYRFRVTDLAPGVHQFRLRQVDFDGTASFSDTKTLAMGTDGPFTMVQNLPNPIGPGQTATLKYVVRDREPVQVELYNVLGQRVRVLHDGVSTPGSVATVQLSTSDLASGMYFVRITGTSFSRTERVSVVR